MKKDKISKMSMGDFYAKKLDSGWVFGACEMEVFTIKKNISKVEVANMLIFLNETLKAGINEGKNSVKLDFKGGRA